MENLTHEFKGTTRNGRVVLDVRYYPDNSRHRQLLVDLSGQKGDAADTECYGYTREGKYSLDSGSGQLDLIPLMVKKVYWATVCGYVGNPDYVAFVKDLHPDKPSDVPAMLGEDFLGFYPIEVMIPGEPDEA